MIKTVLKWFGYTVITMEETKAFHEGLNEYIERALSAEDYNKLLKADMAKMYVTHTASHKKNIELSKERQKVMKDAIDQIGQRDAMIKSQTDTISKLTKNIMNQKSTIFSQDKELESYRAAEVVKDAFKDLGKSMGI